MKTVVKQLSYLIVLLVLILVIIFFTAGKYLDITQKPIKSDLIICLGGGGSKRIQKSMDLYNEGYSEQKLLLLVGKSDTYKKYVMEYYPETRYIVSAHYNSTAKEIRFIKKYMAENHYKSVIIVSDPPHTRRIKILTDLISVKNDEKFSYVFVSSGVSWWHKNKYYQNPQAFYFAFSEILKIPYTYLYYGLMENLGITWNESEYLALKKRFNMFMWQVWKLIRSSD